MKLSNNDRFFGKSPPSRQPLFCDNPDTILLKNQVESPETSPNGYRLEFHSGDW
jgi:hypothetical protein